MSPEGTVIMSVSRSLVTNALCSSNQTPVEIHLTVTTKLAAIPERFKPVSCIDGDNFTVNHRYFITAQLSLNQIYRL
jgi:hypothetical protein